MNDATAKDGTRRPTVSAETPNAFKRDKRGTDARSDAQAAIEALRQRGGVFVEAVRATRMPMAVTDPNLPGNPIVYANESFLKLSGYSMDEVLGQQPHFMDGPDTDPHDTDRFAEALRSDHDDIVETVQYRKDGSKFVAAVLLSAFKDGHGNTSHHFLSWLDVTRRVEAEERVSELRRTQKALRTSEAKYRGLFDSIDEGFCVIEVLFDDDGQPVDYVFLEANAAFERQTGISQPVGRRMRDIAPDHEEHWFETYGQIALTGEPRRFQQPAEALGRFYDVYAFRMPHPEQRHVAILFNDITDRVRAETARRQSEAELQAELRRSTLLHGLSARLVAEESLGEIYKEIVSTAVAIAEADAATVQIYEPATQSLRLVATHGIDEQMAEYFERVDARSATVCGTALRTGERTFADFDADLSDPACRMHVNAGLRSAQSTPVLNRDGMPIGMISTHWRESGHRSSVDQLRSLDLLARLAADVIEQRRAEAELRKSEHRRVSALLAAEMGTWDYDLVADVCHFDARAQELYNLPSDQLDHRPEGVGPVVHPDDVGPMFEEIQRASDPDGEGRYDMVYRIARDDGTYRWLRAVGVAEFEGCGNARRAVRIVGASRDITLEREAEAALRESEAKYRSLFEAMDEGYLLAEVIIDERTGLTDILYLEANAAAVRIAGREFTGRRMRDIDPNYEEFWYELYDRVACTGEPSRGEHFAAPHDLWFEFYVFKVGDEQSRRVASIFQDITKRKREERLLRESEERQAFLLKLSDALRPLADAAVIQSTTARLLGEYLGVDRSMYAEVEGEQGSETGTIRGQYVRHSEIEGAAIEPFPDHFTFADFGEHTMARRYRGEPLVVSNIDSAPGFQPEEREAWRAANVRSAIVIELVKEGRLVAEFGVHCAKARYWTDAEVDLMADVAERTWAAAERARSEEALRDSEERLRLIVENAEDYAIFTTDPDGIIVDWREGAEAIFGYSGEEVRGEDCEILFTPEDRENGAPEKERATAASHGKASDVRWHLRKDGTRVFIDGVSTALRDAKGKLIGFLKIGQDITEKQRASETQKMLLAELQHRVRNLLAMFRAVVRRTSTTKSDVEDFVQHLQGRIDAMARTQTLLTRAPGKGVDLEDVVRDELVAQSAPAAKFGIYGPPVSLSPHAAEVLTLAIHELATNSVKYGALGSSEGKITIAWECFGAAPDQRLELTWQETGLTPRTQRRAGFGTELIQQRVPYELKGRGELHFAKDALTATIEFPLEGGSSILETAPMPPIEAA